VTNVCPPPHRRGPIHAISNQAMGSSQAQFVASCALFALILLALVIAAVLADPVTANLP
jgi:hypothetical protein